MKKHAEENIASLAEDAQDLISATANVAESKVIEARKRLADALDRGKEAWGQFQDSAVAQAKAADEVIRDYPYYSIGIAFGVGALLGLLFRRRA